MNEPFEFIPYNQQIIDPETGKEVPNFRCSRLVSCYEAYNNDLDEEKKQDITDEYSDIADEGHEVHEEDNILTEGSRNIIDREEELKLVHKSKKFTLTGHLDYNKFDFGIPARYIEDLKSCKKESFFFFLQCIEKGLGNDYITQLSEYSYMKYIKCGIYHIRGVVTRIKKRTDDDKRIIRMSIEDKLYDKIYMRKFFTSHPVILFKLGYIKYEQLKQLCITQMKDQSWKCTNCQYSKTCTIKESIV